MVVQANAVCRISIDGAVISSCMFCCQMSMQFVESMLEIHGKYSELVQSVFSSDQLFYGALDKVPVMLV